MDKLAGFLGLLRDGVKAGGKYASDLVGLASDKAAANPKATAALATGAGLWLNPSWIVAAGTYTTKFGRFLAQIGAAMGG